MTNETRDALMTLSRLELCEALTLIQRRARVLECTTTVRVLDKALYEVGTELGRECRRTEVGQP